MWERHTMVGSIHQILHIQFGFGRQSGIFGSPEGILPGILEPPSARSLQSFAKHFLVHPCRLEPFLPDPTGTKKIQHGRETLELSNMLSWLFYVVMAGWWGVIPFPLPQLLHEKQSAQAAEKNIEQLGRPTLFLADVYGDQPASHCYRERFVWSLGGWIQMPETQPTYFPCYDSCPAVSIGNSLNQNTTCPEKE